jgi:hypothetical protein
MVTAQNEAKPGGPPFTLFGSLLILGAFALLAALTYNYAGKVGIKNPLPISLLNFIPIINWVAFLRVVGFTPDYLRAEERAREPAKPPPFFLVAGILPAGLFILLLLWRTEYMSQFFTSFLGWALFLLLVALVGLNMQLVRYVNRKRWVRGWWTLVLIFCMQPILMFPAIWLVLMGPALVTVYDLFLP